MNARHQTWSIDRAVAHGPPASASIASSSVASPAMSSPLALDGWLEFNSVRWGVQAVRVRLSEGGSEIPAAHAVYYLKRNGQVWQPPTSMYLPVEFESTPTQSRARLDRQWLAVGRLLAEDMKDRGVSGLVALPPSIDDVRPWQWAGFGTSIEYTYHLDLPYPGLLLDAAARRQIGERAEADFSYERVTSFRDVLSCIDQTERREGRRSLVSEGDLELARELVGDDVLRAYVCYATSGKPASARVILHQRGGQAIDWLAGTSDCHVQSGATEFLLSKVLADLRADGSTGFDSGAADSPDVSALASVWGGRLVPHYLVEAPGVRGLVRKARQQWQYESARRKGRRA